MLADMTNIPAWAWAILAALTLAFLALAWAACKASAYYSREEEAMLEDNRRYNEDNARAFARQADAESGLYSRVPQHLYP